MLEKGHSLGSRQVLSEALRQNLLVWGACEPGEGPVSYYTVALIDAPQTWLSCCLQLTLAQAWVGEFGIMLSTPAIAGLGNLELLCF